MSDFLDGSFDTAAFDGALLPLVGDATDEIATITSEVGVENERTNHDRKVTKRGLGFSSAEDLLVCKSWAQSKRNRPLMKKESFMDEMVQVYDFYRAQDAEAKKEIISITLPSRTPTSIFQRFSRVIAPSVKKFHSIVETTPRAMEEDDQLYWTRLIQIYTMKEGHRFAFQECYDFLVSSHEFQNYNDKGSNRRVKRKSECVLSSKQESEFREASPCVSSLFKKVKSDSLGIAAVRSTLSTLFAAATALSETVNSTATFAPARVFSSRGGKSGAFCLRRGTHVHHRVIPLTDNVFQDELLQCVSDMVEATHSNFPLPFIVERSDDDEVKKSYANALTMNVALGVQEKDLFSERHAISHLRARNTCLAKNSQDAISSCAISAEQRIQIQEQFWLGESKKGSMKDRLDKLELFINNVTCQGGFNARLVRLEQQGRHLI